MSAPRQNPFLEQAQKLEQALLGVPPDHHLRELLESSAKLLTEAALSGQCQNAAHDNTKVALIDRGYHWLAIDGSTPRGSKMQLINRKYGVANYGSISSRERFFTHWAPLPTFKN